MSVAMQIGLRKKWRRLAALAGIWVFVMFPIPFLPLWGYEINPQAMQAIVIIMVIVTTPLVFLFIFMK